MKKFRLLLIVAFLISFSANTFADGKKVGIRAGYQMSNMYYNGSSLDDAYSSFYVGLFKEKRIVPMLNIGGGLDYFQNGTYTDGDNYIKFQYLSIPIYGKVKIGPFYGLGGAAASFLLSDKWVINGNDYNPGTDANNFDIPLFAGVGFKFLMLSVELRYNWGTTALYDNGGSIPIGEYKTQYLQLGLAVSL